MPKQLIHEGPQYRLIPMPDTDMSVEEFEQRKADGDLSSYAYERAVGPRIVAEENDGVLERHEPSIVMHWSKARDTGAGDPGDYGYVNLEMVVDTEWLKSFMENLERAALDGRHVRDVSVMSASLSWRELNELAKAARTARDGAFGKPE